MYEVTRTFQDKTALSVHDNKLTGKEKRRTFIKWQPTVRREFKVTRTSDKVKNRRKPSLK